MKRKQIIAALALAFMLGVFSPVAATFSNISVYAETAAGAGNIALMNDDSAIVASENSTQSSFVGDLATKSVVTLGENITLEAAAEINHDVTINLNGYNITASTSNAIVVRKGQVTILGSGTITAGKNALTLYGSTNASDTNYTNVVVEKDVTLKAGELSYGVAIIGNSQETQYACYGVNFTLKGTIEGNYGISVNGLVGAAGTPVININDGAKISTEKGNREVTLPIYAAGKATWNVGAATLTGKSAVGIKSGTLNFTGTTIRMTGPALDHEVSNNGINGTGSVFQIEENTPPYAGDIELNINGGTYISEQSSVFIKYGKEGSAPVKINVKAGTFKAAEGQTILDGDYDKENLVISGGTFSGSDVDDLKEYLPAGYVINANGAVATAPISGGSSSSSSSSNVLKNENGDVSVEGNFAGGNFLLDAKLSPLKVEAFGSLKYALYDINLLDVLGEKVNLDGSVIVSIKVPTGLKGEKCNVYHVSDDTKSVEKLESTYKDGVISFKVEHFSLYAIVEDGDTQLDGAIATPDTGVLGNRIVGAVSTIMPMLAIAGGFFVIYSRKLAMRRQTEVREAVEMEIRTDAAQIIAETEADAKIERFVAAPMTAADEEEIKSSIFGEKK